MKPILSATGPRKRHFGRHGGRFTPLAGRRASPARATVTLDSLGEDARLFQDLAVRRAREAGGPNDRASYSCACGYVFDASVSTSVCCPNCGSTQAW